MHPTNHGELCCRPKGDSSFSASLSINRHSVFARPLKLPSNISTIFDVVLISSLMRHPHIVDDVNPETNHAQNHSHNSGGCSDRQLYQSDGLFQGALPRLCLT